MTDPLIKCPRCGMASIHPDDIANGYCGNCHEFTSLELSPLPPKWTEYRIRQVVAALVPVLAELDLPKILLNEPVPDRVREMLFEGDGISLRRGTMFYGDNGEPIEGEFTQAMAEIEMIRARDGSELRDEIRTAKGVPVMVATSYMGVDLSTLGPLPLVWETMVLVGEEFPAHILDPWRYVTRAAAHAGHHSVVELVRQTVGSP